MSVFLRREAGGECHHKVGLHFYFGVMYLMHCLSVCLFVCLYAFVCMFVCVCVFVFVCLLVWVLCVGVYLSSYTYSEFSESGYISRLIKLHRKSRKCEHPLASHFASSCDRLCTCTECRPCLCAPVSLIQTYSRAPEQLECVIVLQVHNPVRTQ